MLGFSRACVLAKDLADCFSRTQKELNLLVISARRFGRQCRKPMKTVFDGRIWLASPCRHHRHSGSAPTPPQQLGRDTHLRKDHRHLVAVDWLQKRAESHFFRGKCVSQMGQ